MKDHEDVVYTEAFAYIKKNFCERLDHAEKQPNEEHQFSKSLDLDIDIRSTVDSVEELVLKHENKSKAIREILEGSLTLNDFVLRMSIAVKMFGQGPPKKMFEGAKGMLGLLGFLEQMDEMLEREERRRKENKDDEEQE